MGLFDFLFTAQPNNVNTMPTPNSQDNMPSNTEEPLIPTNIQNIYESNNIYKQIISEYYTINREIPFINDIYDFSKNQFIEYKITKYSYFDPDYDKIKELIEQINTDIKSNKIKKVPIYSDLLTKLEKNASDIENYLYHVIFMYINYADLKKLSNAETKKPTQITNFSDCLPELIKYSIYLRFSKNPNEIIKIEDINSHLNEITENIKILQDYDLELKLILDKLKEDLQNKQTEDKSLNFFNRNQKSAVKLDIANLEKRINKIQSKIDENSKFLTSFEDYKIKFENLKLYVEEVNKFINPTYIQTG